MKHKPTFDELSAWLEEPLADSLDSRYGKLYPSLLSRGEMVADGTTVLLLTDLVKRPQAVVLCSQPNTPDAVKRAMHRANHAKVMLGKRDGSLILDTLAEGSVRGMSYAVLPYCNSISQARIMGWAQRALLRPILLEWLKRVAQTTTQNVQRDAIDSAFREPLCRLVELKIGSERLRAAAELATKRLVSGAWRPRHVLMHGDLWQGNILIRGAKTSAERWRDRAVVIDWGGSKIDGYAIYDLIRLAQSFRLSSKELHFELLRYRQILECEVGDMRSHLLAALGYLLMNLENFPIDRYVNLAQACLATLDEALAQ